jgi:transposase
MKTSQSEAIELNVEQLQALLDQIEKTMGEPVARPLRQLLAWHLSLLDVIEHKNLSISRLRRMLFGASTERSRAKETTDAKQASDSELNAAQDACAANTENTPSGAAASSSSTATANKQRRRSRNHGRTPASDYWGCEQVMVTHAALSPGEVCAHCQEGTLRRLGDWSKVVRLTGRSFVAGVCYHLERLRCDLCGKLEKAQLPAEAGAEKYDPTVASTVAVLRYGQGLPLNRLQQLQSSAGIPLPASVQWELVRDALDQGIGAAYQHFLTTAAQGQLVHNDDTNMTVLELSAKIRKNETVHDEKPARKGVYTTNILSRDDTRPTISLFFTGARHAGENLRALLSRRLTDLPPPMHMCDGLSRNRPGDSLPMILASCLCHGRRHFHELSDRFEEPTRFVIKCLRIVYRVESRAKRRRLSAEERFLLHQGRSALAMKKLHEWLKRQNDERLVEPNSALGKAIQYMLKRWHELTLFLRVVGAPLDNNLCEQALKMAIRHRKNSLFYKTLRGAATGDVYMSLIHTCYHARVDPFDYLTQLQRHHAEVNAAPGAWMPWNYRQQLPRADEVTPRRDSRER